MRSESVSMKEMAAVSPTNHTDFTKHPGVRHTKSGKWGATIRHPITKLSVWLGSYNTPKEAADAYTIKKLEYESVSMHKNAASFASNPPDCMKEMAAVSPTNYTDFTKHPGVKQTNSGKWGAAIRHPNTKVSVWLGSYNTPKEAADAYTLKKLEYESVSMREIAASFPTNPSDCMKHLGVTCKSSGKRLGTYNSLVEAVDTYSKKQLEFDSVSPQAIGYLRKLPCGIHRRKSGRWQAEMTINKAKVYVGTYDTVEEAEEALNRKSCEARRCKEQALGSEVVSVKNSEQPSLLGETTWTPRHKNCELDSNFGSKMTNQHLQEVDFSLPEDEVKKDEATCKKLSAQAVSRTGATGCATKVSDGDYQVTTGRERWLAEIQIEKARVYLGTYATAEEAEEALKSKRKDLDQDVFYYQDNKSLNGKSTCKQNSGQKVTNPTVRNCGSRPPGVYQRKSGRWYAEVRNPITKSASSVGTYDTAEEAAEALKRKRHEFASMVSAEKKRKESIANAEDHQEISSSQDTEPMNGKPTCKEHSKQKVTNPTVRNCGSKPCGVYQRKSGRWYAEVQNPITKSKSSVGTYDTAEEAAEALKRKWHEVASMVSAEKKHKQSNASVEEDTGACSTPRHNVDSNLGFNIEGIALKPRDITSEHESGFSSESQDIVSQAGTPKLTFENADECRESSMNVENIQMLDEKFGMGVINAYGQLIGEFSRLDDELWLS